MGKRILKVSAIIIAALLCLVLLVLLGAHLLTPVIYNEYFTIAEKEFIIPGLSEGFVPQGFEYVDEENVYLQCGYMSDGSASRIYILPEGEENNPRYITLESSYGKPYTGHTGGITCSGNFVWLANDGEGEDNCIWVLSLEEILAAENGTAVKLAKSFKPENRAAYCFADEEYLWTGEFYRPEEYPTAETHAMTAANNTEHNAIICAYPLDSESELGITDTAPEVILSVTDHVQGFTRAEDCFILSTSYGFTSSHHLYYKDNLEDTADSTLTVNGTEVPVWFLDSQSLVADMEMPPMNEEPVVRDGKMYVLTESACKKYIFGNFIRGRHVYSYSLEALDL